MTVLPNRPTRPLGEIAVKHAAQTLLIILTTVGLQFGVAANAQHQDAAEQPPAFFGPVEPVRAATATPPSSAANPFRPELAAPMPNRLPLIDQVPRTTNQRPVQLAQWMPQAPTATSEANRQPQSRSGNFADIVELEPIPDSSWEEQNLPSPEWNGFQELESTEQLFLNEPAPVFSTGTWFWAGSWYARQDLVMYDLGMLRQQTIGVDTTSNLITSPGIIGNTLHPRFRTDASSYFFTPGMRLTLGRIIRRDQQNRDHMVEFTFLGLFEWSTQADFNASQTPDIDVINFPSNSDGVSTTLGTGSVIFDPASVPVGFRFADSQSYFYETDLNSLELNFVSRNRSGRDRLVCQADGTWVRHSTPTRQKKYLGGIRYMGMNEHFAYSSSATTLVPNESGLYEVLTHNHMIGLQFGMSFIEQHSSWSWGVDTKLGGLANLANRRSQVIQRQGGAGETVRNESLDEETIVFMGEASINGTYYVRPNVALRASYDFMYLTGLVRAPENLGLANNAFPALNMQGMALVHGMHFGLDLFW